MKKPMIELIPERAAMRGDGATEMHVLVRVVPPAVETKTARPPLNLGLVIDRSGSMAGAEIEAAKAAAVYAVRQMSEADRVAVTIFDDKVETIVPSVKATSAEKASAIRAIERVQVNGSTALHAGWVEGGMQVSAHLERDCLNRVLLLTDGQANAGETNPDRICSDVHGLALRGVSTTTLGVGDHYNEDLLQAMAGSGDGNYYHIDGAADLETLFAAELHGLMATIGQTVSLGLEPQDQTRVVDVLNDLERNELDRLMLPNLISGSAVEILVKLQIAAMAKPKLNKAAPREVDVCLFRLAWSAPGSTERLVVREALSLPIVSSRDWDALPIDERVSQHTARMQVTRMRHSAVEMMEMGDIAGAREQLACAAPVALAAGDDEMLSSLSALEVDLSDGRVARAVKSAKYDNYRNRRSR